MSLTLKLTVHFSSKARHEVATDGFNFNVVTGFWCSNELVVADVDGNVVSCTLTAPEKEVARLRLRNGFLGNFAFLGDGVVTETDVGCVTVNVVG